jgi:hypothetical protein
MIDVSGLMRAAARRRARSLAGQDPASVQWDVLRGLLHQAAATRFGRAHDFAGARSVAEFVSRVPLRRYEDFWREWWQAGFPVLRDVSWPGTVPFFAESSGTTSGVSKYIPVSRDMVAANRRAARDVLGFHLLSRKSSRIFGGENFLLGGSTGLRVLAPGVRAGDLSGIAACTVPPLARQRVFPPLDLALISDWDEKLDRLARAAIGRDIRSISGTPSWLLLLFQRLAELHPNRPRSLAGIFPNLDLIIHGGVGFVPYRDAFAQLLDGCHAETREVYPASEGFFAAADAGPEDGLRLMLDNGVFFEFVEPASIDGPSPARRWIADAELGRDYALVVSTNAGLFGYVVGDAVRLINRAPPRIVFAGRLSHELSVFGEHVTGAEMDAAIATAARACGGAVTDYTAAARLPTEAEPRGRHVFVVAFAGVDRDPAEFARVLDAALARGNADYAAHRARDVQLLPPEVRLVDAEVFTDWMRAKGRLGGQNKVPRVVGSEGELPK